MAADFDQLFDQVEAEDSRKGSFDSVFDQVEKEDAVAQARGTLLNVARDPLDTQILGAIRQGQRQSVDAARSQLMGVAQDPLDTQLLGAIRHREAVQPKLDAENEYAKLDLELQQEGVKPYVEGNIVKAGVDQFKPGQFDKIKRMQELRNSFTPKISGVEFPSEGPTMVNLFGDTVAAQLDKEIFQGFKDSSGAVAGGALGARMLTGARAGPLGVLLPIAGAIGGSLAGGAAQEKGTQLLESPEVTAERHRKQAQMAEGQDYKLGGLLAMGSVFRPSLSVVKAALKGNEQAIQQIGVGGGLGAGLTAIEPLAKGELPTPGQVLEGGLVGLALHQPTRLGQGLFGLHPLKIEPNGDTGTVRTPVGTIDAEGQIVHPDTPEGISLRAVAGLDATTPTEIPFNTDALPGDLQSGLTTRGTTSTADVFENVPNRPLALPSADTSGERVQPPWPSNDPVGIRNEFTEAERARLGFPERDDPIARSFPQLHAEAEQAYAQNPEVGRNLVEELKANPRITTGPEEAVLTFEMARQQKLVDRAYEAINSAKTPEEMAKAQDDLSRESAHYQDTLAASELTGTGLSEAFYARRMTVNEDFSLARMLAKERATKEDPSTPLNEAEQTEVTERFTEIKKAQESAAKVEAKKSEVEETRIHQQLLKEVGKSAKVAAKEKQAASDFFKETREAARKRIIGRRGRLLSTVDPLNVAGLADELIIGATHIAEGARDFALWSKKMITEFGERLRPHLQDLFTKGTQLAADYSKPFRKPNPQEILAESDGTLTPELVGDLWLAHIRGGKTENSEIRKIIAIDLKATERQVQEAFTQYGKRTYPSKEADKVMLSEHKTLERINLQIQDLENNVIPKKTGFQRNKASAKVLSLQRQRDLLMRKLGINQTDPATQLASAHTKRVSRLKNTIDELKLNLAEGKRTPTKEGLPWTPDELALQDQVNSLRDQLDSVLNSPENAKVESLIKRISSATEKLMTGNLEGKPKLQTADTASVARLKETLKGLNKELIKERQAQRLKENPPTTPDEKRLAALEKTRDDLALRVAESDISTKTGKPTVATLEQATVMQEIEGLQKVMSELRRAERPPKVGDEAQLASFERQLAKAQAKVASGDFGPASRKATVDTARVAEARAKLEAVNQQIAEARAAIRNSPEAQLARAKENSLARQKAIQARIDANDYAPPAKKDKVMDRELLQHQFDEHRLKEEWQNRASDKAWNDLNIWQKAGMVAYDSPNIARILITSADGPAIFRQTLTSLTTPVKTARAAWRSMQAMFSEKQRFKFQKELEERDNFHRYMESGLRISKPNSSPSRTEEQYMSRMLGKLPWWTGVGPLARASERSFTTYLNNYRADMFDAMYKLYKPGNYELKEMASVINDFTGSATLPKSWEAHVPFMSKLLFAARKTAADIRVATLMPVLGIKGTAKSRLYGLENYARLVGSMGLILGMAKVAGLYYETDLRSTHFGQVYVPAEDGSEGVWHDAFSGPAKAFTMVSRGVTGETKNAQGEIDDLIEPKYGGDTVAETIGNFFANKLSPALSNAKVIVNRREWGGEPITPQSVALRNTVPISWQQLKPILERLGIPKGFASQAFQLLGGGAQAAKVDPR